MQRNSKMIQRFKLYIVVYILCLSDINCMRTTHFYTTKDYGYVYLNENEISTSGSTFITFHVQACNDAHIALKSRTKEQPIEIVIGGWNNKQSCIRLTPQGSCSVKTLGSVLDCKEYRSFTVYWGDRQILVEKGNTTSEKSSIFLSLPLNYNLHNVNVGISTGFGSYGKWMIEDIYCLQTTCISTSIRYDYMYLDEYGISTSGSTFITFQVQACNDAHIALKSYIKEQPIEIVIGGWNNKQSCIRLTPQGVCLATNLGAVLNCKEYRSFTVYWGEGQILVKKGNATTRKSSIFLSLPLNYNLDDVNVGISTGFGSSGRWMIKEEQGSVTSTMTQGPPLAASPVALIVGLVGAVIIFGMIVGVFSSFRNCKNTARSQPECTNKYIKPEPERQHRLGILSEHLYDSISDPTVHTYLALCSQYLKLNIMTKKPIMFY